MANKRHIFRNGSRIAGVSADEAEKELDRIYTEHGVLDARNVVDESQPEEAPLHPAFLWDDAAAADSYRLHQARSLIRDVQVIYEDKDTPKQVYVYVPSPEVQSDEPHLPGYYPMVEVAKNPTQYQAALMALAKDVSASVRSLEALKVAAEGQKDNICAMISVAAQALEAATEAIKTLKLVA